MALALHHLAHLASPSQYLAALAPSERQELQRLRREIRGISLDLWGTILDDRQAPADTIVYSGERQRFLLAELRRHGFNASAEEVRAAYEHAWNFFEDLWRQQKVVRAEDGIRVMLDYLQVDLPASSRRRVLHVFEEFRTPPPPLEGALPAIRRLSSVYPLALISDTGWTPGRVLRRVFQHYGILSCFRTLVFSDEAGHTKPHPHLFERALAGLQLQANQCIHTGDLQRTDIAGARAAGMRTAWIYRPVYAGTEQEDRGPDLIISSVAQLTGVLIDT